jgi:phosphohistidine phosphatase
VRTLLLLRHAKSSWDDATLDDHARPLNPRGQRDAPRMGELLAEQKLLPSLLLTSTAARAVATARAITEASGYRGEVRALPGIYGVSAPMLVALLQYEGGDHGCVMLIGHNPSLEELLEGLCGEHHRLPTAALARVDLPIATWGDLALKGKATAVRVWRPKEL